jgi:hypothetical protein
MSNSIWRFAGIIGAVCGAISIVLLVRQAVDIGLVAPLQTMLDWYRAAIDLLLSPIAPAAESGMRWLQQRFPDLVDPSPDWKHYLVIGVAMYGAASRASRNPDIALMGLNFLFICWMMALTDGDSADDRARPIILAAVLLVAAVMFALFRLVVSRVTKPSYDSWTISDFLALIRSLGVVFGGAALFIVLNAGLKLGGL